MKVSVVTLLQESNIENFNSGLEVLKKQTLGFDNMELIVIDQAESKSEEQIIELAQLAKKANVCVQHDNSLKVEELRGKYISFFDFNYSTSPHLYKNLCREMDKHSVDFVSANLITSIREDRNLAGAEEVIGAGVNAMAGLKLINKESLLKIAGENKIEVSDSFIELLNINFYLRPFTFKYVNKQFYRNKFTFNESYVNNSISHIGYIAEHVDLSASEKSVSLVKVQLLKHLTFLLDKNMFTDNLSEEEQAAAYDVLRNFLGFVSKKEIQSNDLDGYTPLFNMVNKKLDEEATHYIKLLRSKRHWYEQTNKYKQYFEKNPYDLEESLSWKLTKPLRLFSKWSVEIKQWFYKVFLLTLAAIWKPLTFNRKIWLVGEREDQAEDNGYFFFKHCRENYPKEKVYYIISKDSPHLYKVKKLGNVIYHSSLKHKLYMLVADTYISAWTFDECSYPAPKKQFIKMFGKQLAKKFTICLQHGVIIHNISPYLHKDRYNQNLIISSSEYEKKIIQNTLGYSDQEVAVTGLARFDNLHELSLKKQILIMPTWRRHLFKINKSSFLRSDYYKAYRNLISNKEFLDMIERHNISVKFYIHNQMQKFMDNFVVEHPNIEFLVKSTGTVSELLKESSLLITDYSSVSSDFLYMNKPVVMYQFDPHNNHHAPVKEIQYSNLGSIVSNENELVQTVQRIVENDFKADRQYVKNSQRIFKYKDQNNCQRIYEVIKQKTS